MIWRSPGSRVRAIDRMVSSHPGRSYCNCEHNFEHFVSPDVSRWRFFCLPPFNEAWRFTCECIYIVHMSFLHFISLAPASPRVLIGKPEKLFPKAKWSFDCWVNKALDKVFQRTCVIGADPFAIICPGKCSKHMWGSNSLRGRWMEES